MFLQNTISPPTIAPDVTALFLALVRNMAPCQLDGLELHRSANDVQYWFEDNCPEVIESHEEAWRVRIDWLRVWETLRLEAQIGMEKEDLRV